MRAIAGYQLKIEAVSQLTEKEREHLSAKIAFFAISIENLFATPVIFQDDNIIAHYNKKEHAEETLEHVRHYLHHIGRESEVRLTLTEIQLLLDWDTIYFLDDEQGKSRSENEARNSRS